MKTPLSISMSELSKVAAAAADRADQAARKSGITPAGLLKRERTRIRIREAIHFPEADVLKTRSGRKLVGKASGR